MSLKITRAGLLDSVQDPGRYGYRHLGINPGGAMDRFAASLGNALLGSPLQAPVIEMHFPAADFLFQEPAVFVLTGADFAPCINGENIAINKPLAVRKGSVLSFRKRLSGTRCYLAFVNSLTLQPWLHSCSTNLKAAAGGWEGRPLKKGDVIPFSPLDFAIESYFKMLPWAYHPVANHHQNEIQVIPGPEWNWLTEESKIHFTSSLFSVTADSDRMGYRLQGTPLEQSKKEQLLSSAVTMGTVQLLPNGQLIVLMADHQTTGGYPRIANVTTAELSKLAQMVPGEACRFQQATVPEAELKWKTQQQYLMQLQDLCAGRIRSFLKQKFSPQRKAG